MLHAPAAEKDGNLGFHMQTIPFSRKSEIIRQIVFEQHGAHPLRRKPRTNASPSRNVSATNSRSSGKPADSSPFFQRRRLANPTSTA